MRFSPVLFAVLTASATLGSVCPAKANTPDPVDQSGDAVSNLEIAASSNTDIPLQENLEGRQPSVDRPSTHSIAPTASAPESPAVGFFDQAAARSSQPPAAASASMAQVINTLPPSSSLPAAIGAVHLAQADAPGTPTVPGSAAPDSAAPGSAAPTAPGTVPSIPLPTGSETVPTLPTAPATPTAPGTPETTPPTAPATPTAPSTVPTTPETTPPESSSQPEPRVLVAEVAVSGVEGDLLNRVYQAIRTQPGRTTTRSQLQEDINAIFATGYFANVRAVPEDTPLGVRVTFEVQPNPELRAVRLQGSAVQTVTYKNQEVPLQQAVDDIFGSQYGNILNLNDFQAGITQLNKLYQDNGYVLAQVVGAPQVSPDGTATLEVAEGVISSIKIRFLDRDGNATDDQGNPIKGKTRNFIITREFDSQPGQVFNQRRIQADLQRAFGLGIFEDLQVALNPAPDNPRQVDVTVNVTERRTGTFGASAGVSSADGLFGALSIQEQNLGGNNQTLSAEVQAGLRSLQFDTSFSDPWIAGDPYHTSYSVNAFGRQSISLVFDGGPDEVNLPNGDRPRVYRLGGGTTFSRPLGNGWTASLGVQYQNVSIRDSDGNISP
ncbi:MAG TPA: POTRA domain-containing protein, partial [Coleofasciculaceae cyanobacterium]